MNKTLECVYNMYVINPFMNQTVRILCLDKKIRLPIVNDIMFNRKRKENDVMLPNNMLKIGNSLSNLIDSFFIFATGHLSTDDNFLDSIFAVFQMPC